MVGETVWVLPRQTGQPDAHGNVAHTWPTPEDEGAVQVDQALVAPRTDMTGELAGQPHREAVVIGLQVFLPPGSRMEPVDRMYVRGETYEVVGEPGVWNSAWTAREWGVQVALRRTEG